MIAGKVRNVVRAKAKKVSSAAYCHPHNTNGDFTWA